MTLDIRQPMGLMFTLVGALLALYGLVAGTTAGGAAWFNIDAWWGGLLTLFGVAMLGLAARARRAAVRHAGAPR